MNNYRRVAAQTLLEKTRKLREGTKPGETNINVQERTAIGLASESLLALGLEVEPELLQRLQLLGNVFTALEDAAAIVRERANLCPAATCLLFSSPTSPKMCPTTFSSSFNDSIFNMFQSISTWEDKDDTAQRNDCIERIVRDLISRLRKNPAKFTSCFEKFSCGRRFLCKAEFVRTLSLVLRPTRVDSSCLSMFFSIIAEPEGVADMAKLLLVLQPREKKSPQEKELT